MFSSNTSAVSGDAVFVEDVFSAYLYDGNSTAKSIVNGIDLATKGGLVWTKNRGNTQNHWLVDSARGNNKLLSSHSIASQYTSTDAITGFNTDGYSLGADTNDGWGFNTSGTFNKLVSWTFRKQPKFFDVVTFTANGSNPQTISHSLGSTPGCIIVKSTDNTASWLVYHRGLSDPNNQLLNLNGTGAIEANSGYWGSGPTSTTFQMNTAGISGWNFVAYVFAHNAGGFGLTGTDNVISCGSFTTDGSGRATVELGYEPQWLMQKSTGTGRWEIEDVMRGWSRTSVAQLMPNLSNAEEVTDGAYFTPTATGFTTISAGLLLPSVTYIYIAIRRGPMKVPTDATKVFNTIVRAGTSAAATITGVGFPPDSALIKNRAGNTNSVDWSFNFFDKLRKPGYRLSTGFTNAEDTSVNFITSFDQDGMTLPSVGYTATNGGYNYIDYFFRRAPSFFDEVCYTGNGTAGTTYTHNLGVAPELWIVKKRSAAGSWTVGSTSIANSEVLYLQATDAKTSNTAAWNSTYPSSTVLTVGNSGNTNGSGSTYVAYLFATCPGVSKVGSYTGTGTTQTINCGFAAGARFVMIKRTDDAASWYVWDTARGMVSGTDPSLQINWYSGEVAGDSVYTVTTGFQIVASPFVDVNTNGGSYIYLAIA